MELGTVAHEIGHAMGLYHEQSRHDRDDHVIINLDNVHSSRVNNFRMANDNNYSVQYDYSSDMHYGPTYFSKNGHLTIATKDPMLQGIIGQRTGLSHYDKLLINRMYPCISSWLAKCSLTTDPCQNNGYTGKECKCVCPRGTSGTNCETNGPYYDALMTNCSEKITAEKTITSPKYPNNYASKLKCTKEIEAPTDKVVQITLNDFHLYEKKPFCTGGASCCYYDILVIRNSTDYDGDTFCGSDIAAGRVFTFYSNKVIIFFSTRTGNMRKGFSADVKFIAASAPTTTTVPTTTVSTTTVSTTTVPTTTVSTTTAPPPTVQTTTGSPPTVPTTAVPTTTGPTPTESPPTSSRPPPPPAPPGRPRCMTTKMGNNFLFTSPMFGHRNYPNNMRCIFRIRQNKPARCQLTFEEFDLEPPADDDGSRNHPEDKKCYDALSIFCPYGKSRTFCGKLNGTIALPTMNFNMRFSSDCKLTRRGFNISISRVPSECHKVIYTGGETSGIISSPDYRNFNKSLSCEWWIRAPFGKKIQLVLNQWQKYRVCKGEHATALVNPRGSRFYNKRSSVPICDGTLSSTFSYKSKRNRMNVVFIAPGPNRGFKASWKILN